MNINRRLFILPNFCRQKPQNLTLTPARTFGGNGSGKVKMFLRKGEIMKILNEVAEGLSYFFENNLVYVIGFVAALIIIMVIFFVLF